MARETRAAEPVFMHKINMLATLARSHSKSKGRHTNHVIFMHWLNENVTPKPVSALNASAVVTHPCPFLRRLSD